MEMAMDAAQGGCHAMLKLSNKGKRSRENNRLQFPNGVLADGDGVVAMAVVAAEEQNQAVSLAWCGWWAARKGKAALSPVSR